MKTAEEILRDNCTQWLFLNADEYEVNCIVNAMKEYAKEVAREALKNASDNARTNKVGNSGSWYDAGVDKQSILDENNIPEL